MESHQSTPQHRSFRLTKTPTDVSDVGPAQALEHRSFRLTKESVNDRSALPDEVSKAYFVGLVLMSILIVLTALLLDGGVLFGRARIACAAYLSFLVLCLLRRRLRPTKVDLLFIKYGAWLLFALTCFVAAKMGRFG